MVLTGSLLIGSLLAGSSAVSSSAKPFLNDLMPLAKSPIRSEILPRPPNSSRPTAKTRIQCQMLIEPIANPPHGRGRLDLSVVAPKLGAGRGKNKESAPHRHARA